MDKLEEISQRRKKAHRKLIGLKSKVYAAFLQMERATYADGALSRKTKELIAIGISVLTTYQHHFIDIPTGAGQAQCSREGVRAAVHAALQAGAGGVILSRKYSEMRLDNLSGAGDALREWLKASSRNG